MRHVTAQNVIIAWTILSLAAPLVIGAKKWDRAKRIENWGAWYLSRAIDAAVLISVLAWGGFFR